MLVLMLVLALLVGATGLHNGFTFKMEELFKTVKTLKISSVKQVIFQELYLTRNPIIVAQMLGLCNKQEETYG